MYHKYSYKFLPKFFPESVENADYLIYIIYLYKK